MKTFFRKIYLYSFLEDFMLVYPIYLLLFQASGLSTFQISTLLSLWAGTSLVLEVPTGIIADRFSRRNILLVAQVIRIAGYACWLFFHTYWGFLAGFMLWGINGALKSGTFEALVYDEMKNMGVEAKYDRVLGKLKLFSFVGLSSALALGGFIAKINYDIPIIISIFVLTLGAFNIATLKDVIITRSTKEVKYIQFLKDALKESWENKVLLQLILAFAFIFGIYGAFDEYIGLIFKSQDFSLGLIGILYASNYVIYALGSLSAGYIKSKRVIWLYSLTLISGLLLFIPGMLMGKYWLMLVLPAAFLLGLLEVKIVAGVQELIASNSRATIISIKVFLQEVLVIAFNLVIGSFSTGNGSESILVLAGFSLITSGILLITFNYIQSIFSKNVNSNTATK